VPHSGQMRRGRSEQLKHKQCPDLWNSNHHITWI
jgi:hypothetical protein